MLHLLIICISTLTTRVLLIFLLPTGAYSLDLLHYLEVQSFLDRGLNPYVETSYLNYGPFWVQFLWALRKFSALSGVDRAISIKLFNSGCDVGSACLLYLIGLRNLRPFSALICVILAFGLNPVVLVISCIHGSFDSFVVFLILVVIELLLRHDSKGNISSWYGGCLLLGYAVLAKTVPFLAFPWLTQKFRQMQRADFIVGLLAFCTPILIGLSTIYVLFPVDVKAKVFRYQSVPGYFGFTGLFRLLGADSGWDANYAIIFKVGLFILIVAEVVICLWRRVIRMGLLIDLLFINFLFLVIFGPGFGPQYLQWLAPFFVIKWMWREGCEDDSIFRLVSCLLYLAASLTLFYEYSHSSGLSGTFASVGVNIVDYRDAQHRATLTRLPLFALLMLAFWLQCCGTLKRFRCQPLS